MAVGLHLLRRSYFLQLANKRRDTIPPEEGEDLQDAAAGRPGKPPPPLRKSLKMYPTFSYLRRPPHLCLRLPIQFSSDQFKSLPEHCLRFKKIGKFFKTKERLKQNLLLAKKPPGGGGPHPSQKKKKNRKTI